MRRRRAAGVLLCARDTGRVLLLLRQDGTWGTPGGMAEAGEDALTAAFRELAEETGYVGGARVLGPISVVTRPDGLSYTTFGATVPREFRCRFDDGEHSAALWVSPDRPPFPLHPGVPRLLALVR